MPDSIKETFSNCIIMHGYQPSSQDRNSICVLERKATTFSANHIRGLIQSFIDRALMVICHPLRS